MQTEFTRTGVPPVTVSRNAGEESESDIVVCLKSGCDARLVEIHNVDICKLGRFSGFEVDSLAPGNL